MMKTAKVFLVVIGLVLLGSVASAFLVERVPPGKLGVRQNLWAGGVVEETFETGFHVGVTGMHKWHLLDRRTHFLTFSDAGTASSVGRTVPALSFRTRDNNVANFDVSVTYRVKPDEAHLLVAEGNHQKYRDLVYKATEDILREEFAQMASEEIYITDERMRVSREALPKLDAALETLHVVPDRILIRSVRFQEGYERRLQEKQLTYQKRRLAEAEKLLEDQRGITETLSAGIEAAEKELRGDRDKELQEVRSANQIQIAGIAAEAQVYEQRTRSDADATYEELIADGTLAIDKAEALRNELRNKALDTKGGRIFLAQQAAENLQFEHITLNSNDPNVPSVLDIGAMVRLLIGDEDD
jgi:regulator of protease activity HflC (stomatin/prohibitin superfamily)